MGSLQPVITFFTLNIKVMYGLIPEKGPRRSQKGQGKPPTPVIQLQDSEKDLDQEQVIFILNTISFLS